MSDAIRLFALLVDDLASKTWREPLAQAAEAGGWTILTGSVDNWPKMTDRCLVISDDPDWGIVIPAHRTAVIMTGPPHWFPDGLAATEAKDQLALASARLAKASKILIDGGALVSGQTAAFDMAELGPVSRQAGPIAILRPTPSPLDIYAVIPPPVGATAVWPASGLYFPVGAELDIGGPEIDLTGRTRVLFHGPHLYLTPGLWRVSFDVSIDPEGKVPPLRFEWKHGEDMVSVDAPVNQPGRYRIQLERRWAVVGPSQIAGWILQAVFQGRIEIHDTTVERVAD